MIKKYQLTLFFSLVLVLTLFASSLGVVNATVYTTLASSITPTSSHDVTIARTISSPTNVIAIGMIFTPNATDYLHFTEVYLRIGLGSPEAWLQMALCEVNNDTIGNTLAGSQIIWVDNTVLNSTYQAIQFPYVDELTLTSGTKYACVLFSPTADVLDSSNFIYVDCVDSTASNANMSVYGIGTWVSYPSVDMKFRILALNTPAPTLNPSATPNPTVYWHNPTPAPNMFSVFLEPMMIGIIITVVIGIVGFYFGGIWGFVACLNLSVGLLYWGGIFELWLVITFIVFDGLLLYAKWYSNNNSIGSG